MTRIPVEQPESPTVYLSTTGHSLLNVQQPVESESAGVLRRSPSQAFSGPFCSEHYYTLTNRRTMQSTPDQRYMAGED